MRGIRLILLTAFINIPFFITQSMAQDLTSRVLACTGITDDEARLHCYDNVTVDLYGDKERSANRITPTLTPDEEIPYDKSVVIKNSPLLDKKADKKNTENWLGLSLYKKNYILPVTYNDRVNQKLYKSLDDEFQSDDVEMKFQLSFELPLWENFLDKEIDLYFAYTQLSFFQAYNQEFSAPFRDTVYEPELGINWQYELEYMGWKLESARLAFNHQSNGRSKPLSRSWNRMIAQFNINKDDVSLGMRAWKRIDNSSSDDDNPDISDYMGYVELFAGYELGPHHLGLMLRNPLDYSSAQVDWSYPVSKNVRLYLQYYNGYGESLLDYDHRVNRVGIGFMLNDWL